MTLFWGLLSSRHQIDGGIRWLLNDSFTDTLTAGNVNGTPATPGPGTRDVTDTGSDLSIGSGVLNIAGGAGRGDPDLILDAVSRIAGRLFVTKVILTAVNTSHHIGWGEDLINEPDSHDFQFRATAALAIRDDDSLLHDVFNYSATTYHLSIVLRSTGAYYFIKGGTFTDWTLIWVSSINSDATVYPGISNFNSVLTANFLRVPVATWLPTPSCYTLFAAANGTSLDALDTLTTGPDSQACTSLSWTEESGDWDIQSNKANPDGAGIATVDAGQADVVVDLTVDGGTAGQPAICLRFADTSNYWYLQADRANNQLELHEYNATVDNVRANAAVTFNDSTDYDLRAICDGQVIDGFADSANKISYGSAALNVTETEHGLYADHTECEFDDFLIFPRDSGYNALDKYIG